MMAQAENDADQAQTYREAAKELSTAIALGLVPYLAQAIDIYDTVESLWVLHGAKTPQAREEARFDLILALIGWVPGPGDGVKKTLRIVNRHPERYAPILFDLLRGVLEKCNIKTSPETLLAELCDAEKLRVQMSEIRRAVLESEAVRALPQASQDTLACLLATLERELPAWMGIVERRLTVWKTMQRTGTARAVPVNRKTIEAPGAKDKNVAARGQDRPVVAAHNQSRHAVIETAQVRLGNGLLGISGEHMADYYCAKHLGWGKGWHAHDHGTQGKWTSGTPGKRIPGKLSQGGVLYCLEGGPNGRGIDAVWRVDCNNQGKPYAIVEAKSSADLDLPAFVKKDPKTGRKPGMAGRLGISGFVPSGEELLEPPTGEGGRRGKPPVTGKPGGRPKAGAKQKTETTAKPRRDGAMILVQMSHEWILKNINQAVDKSVAREIKKYRQTAYSRHLIYVPQWLESARQHAQALLNGTAHDGCTHENHDLTYPGGTTRLHYEEREVREFVNKKKAFLRKKYGNLPTLKEET